jgi:hypothetical protein
MDAGFFFPGVRAAESVDFFAGEVECFVEIVTFLST